jgi:hypothetical protein
MALRPVKKCRFAAMRVEQYSFPHCSIRSFAFGPALLFPK